MHLLKIPKQFKLLLTIILDPFNVVSKVYDFKTKLMVANPTLVQSLLWLHFWKIHHATLIVKIIWKIKEMYKKCTLSQMETWLPSMKLIGYRKLLSFSHSLHWSTLKIRGSSIICRFYHIDIILCVASWVNACKSSTVPFTDPGSYKKWKFTIVVVLCRGVSNLHEFVAIH